MAPMLVKAGMGRIAAARWSVVLYLNGYRSSHTRNALAGRISFGVEAGGKHLVLDKDGVRVMGEAEARAYAES